MTTFHLAWPEPASPTFPALAARFRPLFAQIGESAAARDAARDLPYAAVDALKKAGFGSLLVQAQHSGPGHSLRDLILLLVELGEADSNVAQIFRGHFAFLTSLLFDEQSDWSQRWYGRIANGEIVSPGYTETGGSSWKQFATTLSRTEAGWVVNGTKYYTTGALYSDWIDVSATDPDGERRHALVRVGTDGLSIEDDWDGFGQSLTASGTAILKDVVVDDAEIAPPARRWPLMTAFAQLYHLATLAGIGRAAVNEATVYLQKRKRTYSHATSANVQSDPQVLQLLGQVQAKVYAANVLVERLASEIDRAASSGKAGGYDPDEVARIDIEVYQAQIIVSSLILDATTNLFNALGASALSRKLALDRFWRNARAVSSHNPVVYKERIVGDYIVNGIRPPEYWIAGAS